MYFNANQVDLIFAHSVTYVTSASVLPLHQRCKAPVIILNLQPAVRINYPKTTTGEWLAHCGACPVPELTNAFARSGIDYRVINGLLGLERTPEISLADEATAGRPEAVKAWNQVEEWVTAVAVRAGIAGSRFGFLGNTYCGMLDMYSDFTMLQAQTGMHVEVLEMCDLDRMLKQVTADEAAAKQEETREFFEISEDSPSDPIARKPTSEQLDWSARVACALDRLVKEYDLDALTYYYNGALGGEYEKLQSGFIVGHSLLTARGIPCSGEGDLKTTIGNTQTPVRFKTDPDTYMDAWFAEAPTHHFAMSVGHNASLFEKAAYLMGIQKTVI